jgi:hypothetical protein
MKLHVVFPEINDDKNYRFHLAKTEPSGTKPVDALAKSDEEWLGWQIYRGKAKERFTVDSIVSFAQLSGRKFLFGGIFEIFDRTSNRYGVKYSEKYKDLIGRLVIEYRGENSRATVFKPSYILSNSIVSEIYEYRFKGEQFSSFEEINHKFTAIEIIVNNDIASWKIALGSVYGVYLITDINTGKHYIGSAYGEGGIWGRWCQYVYTYHGNNADLVDLFEDKSVSYFRENFKFSILEVISAIATKEEVIRKESLWKLKLSSREWGYNRN